MNIEDFKFELFKCSKTFTTTQSLNNIVKIIKKINNLINKYKQSNDEKYSKEIINIMLMLNNQFKLDEKMLENIAKYFIEIDNIEIFNKLSIIT